RDSLGLVARSPRRPQRRHAASGQRLRADHARAGAPRLYGPAQRNSIRRAHRPARRAADASLRNPMRTNLTSTRPTRIAFVLLLLPAVAFAQGRNVPPPPGRRGTAPPPAPTPAPAPTGTTALPSAPPLPGEQEALQECKKYPA